eukprot:6040466-Pleurochrysis_carterae.AAC.2
MEGAQEHARALKPSRASRTHRARKRSKACAIASHLPTVLDDATSCATDDRHFIYGARMK